MSAMADCACASMLLGSISLHASPAKLTLLIILYNIIAIGGQALFSASADRVTNKHTGVRMSVLILILGFVFPSKISITAKAVLMAVGNAGFHAYAASSLLSRSHFRASGIGYFTAGSMIGLGLARYAQFIGYFAAAFLMIAATPSDKSEGIPESADDRSRLAPKTKHAYLFVILLAACAYAGSFSFTALDFSWCHGRKALLLFTLAVAAGHFLGGFLFDRMNIALPLISLCGGAALLIMKPDSKLVSLAAIVLLSMYVPVIIAMMFRFMPHCPGLCFSLASASAYLGYTSVRLFPDIAAKSSALMPIVCGAAVIVIALSAAVLYFKAGREVSK